MTRFGLVCPAAGQTIAGDLAAVQAFLPHAERGNISRQDKDVKHRPARRTGRCCRSVALPLLLGNRRLFGIFRHRRGLTLATVPPRTVAPVTIRPVTTLLPRA